MDCVFKVEHTECAAELEKNNQMWQKMKKLHVQLAFNLFLALISGCKIVHYYIKHTTFYTIKTF